MAQEVRSFTVTIPAKTAQDAQWSSSLAMPPRIVRQINATVPPGPRGVMGFRIGSSGEQIIPYDAGQWIVTDDDKIEWPLDNQIDSGAWEVYGYNLGDFDHTIYITFLVDPVVDIATQSARAPLILP